MLMRTAVVVDYQNVHLVGHEAFPGSRRLSRYDTILDPLTFASRLLRARNANQRDGHPHAELAKVLVYRGLPSNKHDPHDYARSMAQQDHWERDPRVAVTLRPLRYRVQRDASGRPATDLHGREIVQSKQEKGVDVLCALAVVREAQQADIDLVILASHDSDLEPAIEEALVLGTAKIETMRWAPQSRERYVYQLAARDRRVWNTRLTEQDFEAARDRTDYA